MAETTLSPTEARYRKLVLAGLAVLILAMAGYGKQAVKQSVESDFRNYYTGAVLAWSGQDLYKTHKGRTFYYPPIFAQWVLPIGWIGETVATGQAPTADAPTDAGARVGAGIWYAILCASYLACLILAVRMTQPESWAQTWWIGFLAFALTARMWVMNVRLGQVNLFVIAWGFLGCYLWTRRQAFGGAVAVAMAAALKYWPGGMLFWILRRKQWTALAGLTLGCVLFFTIAPMPYWGASGTVKLWQRYYEKGRERVFGVMDREDAPGQSMLSMTDRLLKKVSAVSPRRDEPMHINIVDAPKLAKYVRYAIFLVMILLVTWPMGHNLTRPDWRAAMELGMMFLLLLAISPESRRAHFVTMLLPIAALVRHALSAPERQRTLWWLLPVFVLTSLTSRGIWGDGVFYFSMQAYGVMLWGAMILLAVLHRILRSYNDNEPSEETTA